MTSNHRLSLGDLEELLPWHAAGTLDSDEAAEVERALATDPELARRFALVREELTETILLNESLGAPSARAMETLFRAIDQDRKVVRRVASPSLGERVAQFFSPARTRLDRVGGGGDRSAAGRCDHAPRDAGA